MTTTQNMGVELQGTAFLLRPVDLREPGLWALTRAADGLVVRILPGAGSEPLLAGYILEGGGAETAVAVGYCQHGELPEVVRFTTQGIRWRQEAAVRPLLVADDLWVAEAEGAFAAVSVDSRGASHTLGLDPGLRHAGTAHAGRRVSWGERWFRHLPVGAWAQEPRAAAGSRR